MLILKRCTGCKYLVHARGMDVCRATDEDPRQRIHPYRGRVENIYGFRPTLVEMRKDQGKCGPDARLYTPSIATRIWLWLTGGEA